MTSVAKDSFQPVRCPWASGELLIRYHDEEWGVPAHDGRTLFEFLILEGALVGLVNDHVVSYFRYHALH